MPQCSLISMWFFVTTWCSTFSFQDLGTALPIRGGATHGLDLDQSNYCTWQRAKQQGNDLQRVGKWISEEVCRPAESAVFPQEGLETHILVSPSPSHLSQKFLGWAPQSVLHERCWGELRGENRKHRPLCPSIIPAHMPIMGMKWEHQCTGPTDT